MENETKKQVWRITDVHKTDNYSGGWIYIGTQPEDSSVEINFREGAKIPTVDQAIEISLEICELLNSKNKQDGN